MAYEYKNFSKGTLTNILAIGGTFLSVTTDETFPQSDNFKAVIWDAAQIDPQKDLTRELMTLKWNAAESRYDIIGRGEEGTAAKEWAAGSNIAAVMTAAQATIFETAAGYVDQAVKQASSPTFAGLTLSGLTASELLATDASKNLVSLAIATYPSLTEISYIKGLSSAVQAQLNAKGTLSNVVEDLTPQLGGNLDINAKKIVSASNGNIDIEPDGTGNVLLGNFTFDADQAVGAGQDNYVLTYDNAAGTISLEAAAGGGANTALSNLADVAINTTLVSDTDNTDALGTAAIAWSDLFLGNGSVITWSTAPSTADVTLTHSANLLTLAGGDLAISNLTASELVATDADKKLQSLAVATYPSLTELSYVKGVTSAIQTQLGTKVTSGGALGTPSSGTLTNCTGLPVAGLVALTASEIVITTAGGVLASAAVATYPSLTELTYLKGVSSAIQTQLGAKAATDQTMYIGTTAVAINRGSAALTLAGITLTTPNIGTPSAGTLTNCTGLPVSGITASTATALGVGSLELGHASDTTLSRSAAGVLAVEGVVIPSISSTNTLTNKRITLRVTSEASSATPTINTDNSDAHSITALATAITSFTTNLSGTPTNFQKLTIRIKDNGTARAIAWGASFEARGVALPTTTVISKVLTVGFIYDTVTSKWGCVASAQEE